METETSICGLWIKVLDGLNDVLASYQRNNLPDVK
jgi:hypothetical protein